MKLTMARIRTKCQFCLFLLAILAPLGLFGQLTSRNASRLDKLAAESDIVFKGTVVSSREISNAAFPDWGKPHVTEFEPISIFKGRAASRTIRFLHLTGRAMPWGGPTPPESFSFETGRPYLVFAVHASKTDWLYSPASNYMANPNEFRQPMRGNYVVPTLDDRPLRASSIREAHWQEFNLLLEKGDRTNQLYAIEKLDELSLAGRRDDSWRHSDDFDRATVLKALLPLLHHSDDQVAGRAIDCFVTGNDAAAKLSPFSTALVKVANNTRCSSLRRICAIGALSGTDFQAVSNSLTGLLEDLDEKTRAGAVALLPDYPGTFSEQALRGLAADSSPKVRAAVADSIGRLRDTSLLSTLVTLFADPVGRDKPIAPLTIETLESGGRIVGVGNGTSIGDDPGSPGANVGDVHTSAGYALLRFDTRQIEDILKSNLEDQGFRLQFLCRLAERDPAPWVQDMAEVMEARRERNLKKAEKNGVPPRTYLSLTGAYYRCWGIIYDYLKGLPYAAFANGKSDRYLVMLENAGTTGSREPVMLYELFKMKGLNARAARYRARIETRYAVYGISGFFDRVDVRYPDNGVIPDQ